MAAEGSNSTLVRVDVPALKTQKCVVVNLYDSVWGIKNLLREKISQELPNDFLNYGIYLPGSGQRLGKYLDDSRALSEYVLQGNVPKLELRYKSRDYSGQTALTEKAIAKANTKANQKKLLEYIALSKVDKISSLLESGLDPNFVTDEGNTPLGLVCGRGGQVQLLTPLLTGGAHIDFRGKEGLTALHRAAIGGNDQAINVLLSYGASPNYRDNKGLTALYHTVIMGDDTESCEALLKYRAEIGLRDQGGWTELHQVAKYGHIRHGELLIRYGADLNAQNSVGNTPLHVAASYAQTHCVGMLLIRGADKEKTNFSNQTCSQVAILCGHHSISATISAFTADKIETITEPPEYHPNARVYKADVFRERSSTSTDSSSAEQLVSALAGDWESKQESSSPAGGGTRGSDQDKNSDHDSVSIHSTGSSQVLISPTAPTPPIPLLVAEPPPVNPRERIQLAKIGKKYIAIEDVEPLMEEWDLRLWKGMRVDVLYIGRNGYWEGKAGGRQGWFPSSAVKEATDEELEIGKKLSETQRKLYFCNIPEQQGAAKDPSSSDPPSEEQPKKRVSNIHDVIIVKGLTGMGFSMKGIKATKPTEQFHPNPQVPALQYISSVTRGGAAEGAGLKQGDFLIEVNGINVTYSTHDQVVDILKKTGSTIKMKVITPLNPLSNTATQEQFSRKPSASPSLPHTTSSGSLMELTEKETIIDNDNDSISSAESVATSSLRQDSIAARNSPSSTQSKPENRAGSVKGSAAKAKVQESSQETASPQQEEVTEDSPFAKALKDKRKHLQRPADLSSSEPSVAPPQPAVPTQLQPTATPSQQPQPSVSDDKQPTVDLASAIMKAHQSRAGRASLKGPSGTQEMQRPPPLARGNSLANIMLERMEQMSFPDKTTSSDDSATNNSEFDISDSPRAKRNLIMASPKQGKFDAKPEIPTDAQSKSAASNPKSEVNKKQETKSESVMEKKPEANPETKAETKPETRSETKPETRSGTKPETRSGTKPELPGSKTGTPNSKLGTPNIKPEAPTNKPGAPITIPELPKIKPETPNTKPEVATKPPPNAKATPSQKSKSDNVGTPSGALSASAPTDGQGIGSDIEQDQFERKATLKAKPPSSPKLNSGGEHSHDRRQIAPPSNVIVATQFESDEPSETEKMKTPKMSGALVMVDSTKLPPVSKTSQSLPRALEQHSVPEWPAAAAEEDNTGSFDIIPPPMDEDDSILPPPIGSLHASFAEEDFLPPPLVSPPHVPESAKVELSPKSPPPTFSALSGDNAARSTKSAVEEKVAETPEMSFEDMETEFGNLVSELANLGNSDVSGLPPPLVFSENDEIPSPAVSPSKRDIPANGMDKTTPTSLAKPVLQSSAIPKLEPPTAFSEPPLASSPAKLISSSSSEKMVVKPEQESPNPLLSPPPPPPPSQQEVSSTNEQHEEFQTKAVSDWAVDDVCQWLKSFGLEEYVEAFSENEITGEHLVDLTKDDLKELGVKKLGHQKTLLSKIGQLEK